MSYEVMQVPAILFKKRAKICENNLQYVGYEYALWCEAGGKMPASVIFVSYLIKTARLRAALRPNSWIVEFNHKTELQDRIKRLLDSWNEKPTGKSCRITNSLMTAMLVIVTLILPTLITLEPNAGIPDEIIGNDAFILTSENAYLVLNSEGKYEVYADGEYKFTSSWILESSLHIYNEEGVLIK